MVTVMPSDPRSAYKTTREPTGEGHLCRNEMLVDIEYDPEHAPLEEIFLWAIRVAYAEDRAEVSGWTETPAAATGATYTAEIGTPTPRL